MTMKANKVTVLIGSVVFTVVVVIGFVGFCLFQFTSIIHTEFIYDREFYLELASQDGIENELLTWFESAVKDGRIDSKSTDFSYAFAPADFSYQGEISLSFLPYKGKAMRADFFVDEDGVVKILYIGHSSRIALLYAVDGGFEYLPFPPSSITKINKKLAVYNPREKEDRP